MLQSRPTRIAIVAALALGAGACGDDEAASPTPAGETVADYVASASIDGAEGELLALDIPRPTNSGPTIAVGGHSTIVNGGTATLNVVSSTPFETVYVAGSTPISRLFLPVTGFYEIPLPFPMTVANLLLTFPQDLPSNDFQLYVAAADVDGNIGAMQETPFDAIVVGTGDIQVTVTWDVDSDVDLHVVDPDGWEIFWADRQSPSGGELDLDSNPACSIDGVRNENVRWGLGVAPEGMYTVRLDYWSSCDFPETNYTVLINNGGDIEIYRGTFYGGGDFGGPGAGIVIDTFTRTAGPPPVARVQPTSRVLSESAARKLAARAEPIR